MGITKICSTSKLWVLKYEMETFTTMKSGASAVAWSLNTEAVADLPYLLKIMLKSVPVLGQEIALTTQQYPAPRNITLRALEPLWK